MHEFHLEYFIENRYDSPVRKANFQLIVLPQSNQEQKVEKLRFSSSAEAEPHLSKNIFGFEIISYYVGTPFTEFSFKLSADIQKPDVNPFLVSPLLPADEISILNSLEFKIDNNIFLTSTLLTKMPAGLDFSFPLLRGDCQVFDYLTDLNTFISNSLAYSPESTDVNTPIEAVLQHRKGVCQDYAHLFVSVCRQNGIPARYVSGYLNQGEGFLGSSQMHAWAEALVPGLGWVGFDASNNLLADHNYIKIAHGTDYRDCSPIMGVLEATGDQKSTHSVTVTNQ